LENDRAAALLMSDKLNLARHDHEQGGNLLVPVEQEFAGTQPAGLPARPVEQMINGIQHDSYHVETRGILTRCKLEQSDEDHDD
jgi:hypothetical protein